MNFSSGMSGRSMFTSSPSHLLLPPTHEVQPVLASADCLAHDMMTMMTQQKNLIEQFEQLKLQLQFINHELPKDAVKWLSPLTRGLLRYYCAGDPLINGESHFTASFGSSWFINCNCNFNCFKLF